MRSRFQSGHRDVTDDHDFVGRVQGRLFLVVALADPSRGRGVLEGAG